jgi:hypothetical protein
MNETRTTHSSILAAWWREAGNKSSAEQETEGWLSYIMSGTDTKPVSYDRLIWTDTLGNDHPITRVSAVRADGTFRGLFADDVHGVFRMRDCRTA